ncbi:MAG: hypothetical protein Kow006_18640 [Gammaproteobacteria bacterium]
MTGLPGAEVTVQPPTRRANPPQADPTESNTRRSAVTDQTMAAAQALQPDAMRSSGSAAKAMAAANAAPASARPQEAR